MLAAVAMSCWVACVSARDIAVAPLVASGQASLTHYSYDPASILACGCGNLTGQYPTAAINQAIYGSSIS